ncbi:uncharacterized protein LOC122245135 [Penaeus japonicus]|uniref:uncharacterized protein LOC122245135 n=1 Tax=Penaeus japonicus TaxID=27405 RepID=UPI001C713804|nr:uncharacterized protein LOC122245135 [Penaeus japonicus]
MPWKCLAALSILVALATPHTPPTSAHASHVTQTESLQCGDPKRVVLAANFTIDAINVFKNDFALQEFEVPWDKVDSEIDPRNDYLFALVCDLQDHCLRVLPNITSKSHQPPQTPEDARRILVEVLGYSQRYALALETFFLDRSLYEESFLRQVDDVHRHIEDLILILMDDAGACDLSPNEHLIRNFVQMVYHGVQEELRELRDFAILRQCLLGMRYIADVFSGGIWHRSL